MASIVDERGFNQGFKLTPAQLIRLRRRAEAIVAEMRLPADPAARAAIAILELGCGTGELAAMLAEISGCRVTGVDLSARFIADATASHRHPRLRFIVANLATENPVSADDRYQYIVGNGILHHLYHHLDGFLPALARWLTPGGKLIFWEPNLRNPYVYLIFSYASLRKKANLEPDEMAFTGAFIREKLRRAGFRSATTQPRDFLLPNTPGPLIRLVIGLGAVAEKIPLFRHAAQSLFIVAEK